MLPRTGQPGQHGFIEMPARFWKSIVNQAYHWDALTSEWNQKSAIVTRIFYRFLSNCFSDAVIRLHHAANETSVINIRTQTASFIAIEALVSKEAMSRSLHVY